MGQFQYWIIYSEIALGHRTFSTGGCGTSTGATGFRNPIL
jgi:hypothetical protein